MIDFDSFIAVDGRRVVGDLYRFVTRGRALLGVLLSTAHERFRTVIAIYIAAYLGTFYALRLWVWPRFEADLLPRNAVVVAARPFEVILLQIQVSAIVCSLLTALVVVYLSKSTLAEWGLTPNGTPPRAKVVGSVLLTLGLFATGVAFAYFLLISVLFDVLAANAVATGLEQTYSIIEWAYYIVLVSLAWGFAVSLPFVMAVFASMGVVSHEVFRSNWWYVVVLTVIAGAVVSMLSNDPIAIDMLVVVVPVVVCYRVGIYGAMIASSSNRERSAAKENTRAAASIGTETARSVKTAETDSVGERSTVDDTDATAQRIVQAVVTRALDIVNRFRTEEMTTEDLFDYSRDARTVGNSLRPHIPRITAIFTLVTAAGLVSLYYGGLNTIKTDFSYRLPAAVTPDQLQVVLLTPADALMTELKIGIALGVVTVLPLLLHSVWPTLTEVGVVSGNRDVFKPWAVLLLFGLPVMSLGSYLFVAPSVTGYLIHDAAVADMVVAYQVPSFLFLLFFLTVGVGLLVEIPLTMVLFQRGGVLSYQGARIYWWVVVLGVVVFVSALTSGPAIVPVVSIPLLLAYGIGLLLLRNRSTIERSKPSDFEADLDVDSPNEESITRTSESNRSGTNWTFPLAGRSKELVSRFVPVFVLIALIGGIVFPFTDSAINVIWYSLLPADATPRVYAPLALVLSRLELTLVVGLVVSLPALIYQAFHIACPDLGFGEHRRILAAVPGSVVLAVLGGAFAFFAVIPLIFSYFLYYSESAAPSAFGLAATLGLVVLLSGFFALAFQIPLVVLLAIKTEITTREWLVDRRLYFWGGFAGVASLSSSNPTGIAPTIAAVTMIGLFEASLLVSLWSHRSKGSSSFAEPGEAR